MSGLTKLSDNEIEDRVLQSEEPLLVDFWAEWCGPCRAIAPTLEELDGVYQGRATIAKLNIDENPAAASRYGVQAIPTMILFQGGEEKARLVGAHPRKTIAELLDKFTAQPQKG